MTTLTTNQSAAAKSIIGELAAYGDCNCQAGSGDCAYCIAVKLSTQLGPWTDEDQKQIDEFLAL